MNGYQKGRELTSTVIQTKDQLKMVQDQYYKWNSYNDQLLQSMFTTDEFASEYRGCVGRAFIAGCQPSLSERTSDLFSDINDEIRRLESISERLELIQVALLPVAREAKGDGDEVTQLDPIISVERICNRISLVVHQLRQRHDSRSTLDVEDEYDLQDLLHALLNLFFDDVRPEEYTPSYAGKATRMDFLLKNESIVIEVKMTRKGLASREVGEQLIVDIAHYTKHPSCKILFCLVYDPEHRINNPRGLEKDLSQMNNGLDVKVFVVPSGT